MKATHVVLAYLVLGVLVTGTLADKCCTKLVVTYDDAQDHTETCAAVDDSITTVVVPYGSRPIVRGIYSRVPSDDGPTLALDKYYSLAVRLANSNQPLRKLGRGYSGFPVANLQRNASLQTREYNVSEASCRGGLEVCAIVDIRSSGRRVNITRGCMLIKCLPQDEPVPTPARNVNVPATPCANCTLSSNATSHSGPVPTRPVAFSGGTPDTETSAAPPASSNTQDLYYISVVIVLVLLLCIICGCGCVRDLRSPSSKHVSQVSDSPFFRLLLWRNLDDQCSPGNAKLAGSVPGPKQSADQLPAPAAGTQRKAAATRSRLSLNLEGAAPSPVSSFPTVPNSRCQSAPAGYPNHCPWDWHWTLSTDQGTVYSTHPVFVRACSPVCTPAMLGTVCGSQERLPSAQHPPADVELPACCLPGNGHSISELHKHPVESAGSASRSGSLPSLTDRSGNRNCTCALEPMCAIDGPVQDGPDPGHLRHSVCMSCHPTDSAGARLAPSTARCNQPVGRRPSLKRPSGLAIMPESPLETQSLTVPSHVSCSPVVSEQLQRRDGQLNGQGCDALTSAHHHPGREHSTLY